ncbi:ABC transporter permease [bacterium]|nr:ABC transporter permease [bacterium]
MAVVTRFLGGIGRSTFHLLGHIHRLTRLTTQALHWTFLAPLRGQKFSWQSTFEQMVRIGYESIPIVALISFFVGLIIAMQSAYQLQQFGATIYVANLVAVSITRELAPLLTAIIVTGRSGSAITAEIGTMKVSEEIDALRTMGFNPIKFLVVPRTLAMIIMVPCLTIIGDFIGIFGGYLIAMASLDITSLRYINQTVSALVFRDLFSGLIKSLFFALIIVKIGCYEGFNVSGGAEGVGKSTTKSVVKSIFLIIAADVFFTALFYSTF